MSGNITFIESIKDLKSNDPNTQTHHLIYIILGKPSVSALPLVIIKVPDARRPIYNLGMTSEAYKLYAAGHALQNVKNAGNAAGGALMVDQGILICFPSPARIWNMSIELMSD